MSTFIKSLKVLDASSVLAGPSVGMFFAELGADVTKVEHPIYKDVTRSWKLPTEDKNAEISAYYSSVNYLKKNISIDFKLTSDKDKFIALAKEVDIVLMNFKKGDQTKFGITDKILLQANPKLIIGKINGFGADSDRVAYDLILQAETGFMSMNGTADSGPVKMPVALIDVLAGHQLKEGILSALLDRSLNNLGKVVEVSLYDSAVSSLMNQASNYLMEGHVAKRIGSLHPNIAPYGEIFITKDLKSITFAIGSDKQFNALCNFISLTELSKDQKFSSNQARLKHRVELFEILNTKIKLLNSTEILNYCLENFIPAGQIKNLKEVFETSEAKDLVRTEKVGSLITKRVTSLVFKLSQND